MIVDLDDVEALHRRDPAGMLSAIADLGANGRSADQIAAHLQETARSFAFEAPRDDLAVLVVRRP